MPKRLLAGDRLFVSVNIGRFCNHSFGFISASRQTAQMDGSFGIAGCSVALDSFRIIGCVSCIIYRSNKLLPICQLHEPQTHPLPRARFERRVIKLFNMTKTQKSASVWLIALWCLGAFSPTLFFLLVLLHPHFPLPEVYWQPYMLLTAYSTCVCSATLLQFSVLKRIGLALLAALVMAIQLGAIVFYAFGHFIPIPD